jgi:hypothetical protein
VVQHAIYNAVRPVFDATFIDQNFACRVGKGTHAAADYVQAAIRSSPPDSWALQMDVRRFYPSIDFCGFRTWRGRRFVRKHALYTFRRAVHRGDAAAVASCLAHARRTSSRAGMLGFMDALRIA